MNEAVPLPVPEQALPRPSLELPEKPVVETESPDAMAAEALRRADTVRAALEAGTVTNADAWRDVHDLRNEQLKLEEALERPERTDAERAALETASARLEETITAVHETFRGAPPVAETPEALNEQRRLETQAPFLVCRQQIDRIRAAAEGGTLSDAERAESRRTIEYFAGWMERLLERSSALGTETDPEHAATAEEAARLLAELHGLAHRLFVAATVETPKMEAAPVPVPAIVPEAPAAPDLHDDLSARYDALHARQEELQLAPVQNDTTRGEMLDIANELHVIEDILHQTKGPDAVPPEHVVNTLAQVQTKEERRLGQIEQRQSVLQRKVGTDTPPPPPGLGSHVRSGLGTLMGIKTADPVVEWHQLEAEKQQLVSAPTRAPGV